MIVGDEIVNERDNKEYKIVGMVERNWYEKTPDKYNSAPILMGNTLLLKAEGCDKLIECYEWEARKK